MAVLAMKAGAADFIEKPIRASDLLASIRTALERSRDSSKLVAWQDSAAQHIADLTPRQHQIMDLVLAVIQAKTSLQIWQSTNVRRAPSGFDHQDDGEKSLPTLARLALAGASAMERKPTSAGTAAPISLQPVTAE